MSDIWKEKNVPSIMVEMVMTMYLIEIGGKYGKFNKKKKNSYV